MLIEISNGELLDKLTILEIKLAEIKDKAKLVNIRKEYDTLNPLAKELFDNNDGQLQNHYLELASINSQLWDIEDRIRECEKAKRFDKEFIELARSVYITNDKRSEVKKIINVTTGSNLVEEKSYKEYQN
jgi:hypothetical protein